MKKGILSLMMLMLLVSGCSHTKVTKEQTKTYNSFKESLINNGTIVSPNIPFHYEIKVKEEKGKYHYTVVVNKPLIAMNSIQMMILNPDDLSENYETPTLGIYNETPIHMVPNQSNNESGYVNKLELSGVSKSEDFIVYATLSWKDNDQLTKNQVYFSFEVVDGKDARAGIENE